MPDFILAIAAARKICAIFCGEDGTALSCSTSRCAFLSWRAETLLCTERNSAAYLDASFAAFVTERSLPSRLNSISASSGKELVEPCHIPRILWAPSASPPFCWYLGV